MYGQYINPLSFSESFIKQRGIFFLSIEFEDVRYFLPVE